MKKFYTLALAALCTVCATATGTTELKQPAPQKAAPARIVTMEKIAPVAGKAQLSALADENDGIYGDYTITLGDYYFEDSTGEYEAKATISAGDEEGTVIIDSEEFTSSITAAYDEATGTLSFTKIKLGSNGTHYIRFEPFAYVVVDEKGSVTATDFSATFDAETGTISFPADHGFSWVAYTSALYGGKAGYYGLFDVVSMVAGYEEVVIDEAQEGQWKVVGSAKLEDAWICPSYKFNNGTQVIPSEYPLTAELHQNVDNEKLFRLWRPFHDSDWILVGQNQSSFNGQIVFDITDPDHVVVKAGMPAGFKNQNGDFYVFGMLGFQINILGDNYNETMLPTIYEFMEEKGQPFDTYADGVVSINYSAFDTNNKCSNAYTWKENQYIVSKIYLPDELAEIQAPIVDNDANAPVEYFNLQGVRIQNPENGQVVIRRQGSKVSKIFVK